MIGRLAAAIVRLYQVTAGRLLPGRCRFHPSCSQFAVEAFEANGLVKGGLQTIWRLLRCGPWTPGGIDPVRVFPAGPVRRSSKWLVRHSSKTRLRHG